VRFTATNRAQRGKLALTAAALGIGLLTSGCGYINSQQTSEQYQASDGIVTDLGPLTLSNFLIVSTGEAPPGRVIGAVYNSSSQDVKLTVNGAEGSETEVPVKANSYVLLNNDTDEAVLSTTGGIPGSLVDIKITESGTNVSNTVKVPVLDATLPEYKEYLPAGSTPSPSPTPSPTASELGGGTGH
jgi:ABC-type Fe3+-hydroxamate transport system substrate-binding protein